MLVIHLSSVMVDKINRIGRDRSPNEACGIILPIPRRVGEGPESQVIELPNRSLQPSAFKIQTADILTELEDWLQSNTQFELEHLAVWHTHPAGNIGPSGRDMRYRIPDVPYLVVALQDDGSAIPTWF